MTHLDQPASLLADGLGLHAPALRLYAIVACLVAVNLLVLSGMTGGARGKAKVFLNPEDKGDKGTVANLEHDNVQRVKRAHLNAIESAVIFFPIGFLYA